MHIARRSLLILACSLAACQEDAPKNRFDDIKIDPTIYYQPTPVGDRVPFADMMVAANQLIIMLDATADEPTRAEILTVLDATVIGALPSIRVLQLSLDAPDEAALRDACAVARALTGVAVAVPNSVVTPRDCDASPDNEGLVSDARCAAQDVGWYSLDLMARKLRAEVPPHRVRVAVVDTGLAYRNLTS